MPDELFPIPADPHQLRQILARTLLIASIQGQRARNYHVIPTPDGLARLAAKNGPAIYIVASHLSRSDALGRANRMNAGGNVEAHLWN